MALMLSDRLNKIERDPVVVKCMVALVVAITGPSLSIVLRVAAKVGALG
jgi:hypothetical protein